MTTLKLFDNISRKTDVLPKLGYGLFWLALFVASLGAGNNAYAQIQCAQTITANVVVFDSPTMFNRLGAQNPNWITYALKRDTVNKSTGVPCSIGGDHCTAGNVELRGDKRPRPLVIRSVEGACLTVNFTNLLAPVANPNNAQQDQLFNNDQVAGRCAGFHATGTELVSSMADDGSMVGANPGADATPSTTACGTGGLVAPGDPTITYNLYTPHEGAYIINSYGATIGSEANSGNLAVGMFGALNVQPKGARIYRSQMTEEELRLATVGIEPGDCTFEQVLVDDPTPEDPNSGDEVFVDGDPIGDHGVTCNPGGQPIIDYEALYPMEAPWIAEGKAGLPIINMITAGGELVHSDINAIIAGPNADGTFPPSTYPLESVGKKNPQLPNRLEPFREFTSQYHDEQTNSQVFPRWYNNPVMTHVTHGVKDQFMINYGSGGIGSEIIANRLRTGPMHDCANCAYEEFFLASQTVGDPALLVNTPANTGIEQCDPTNIGQTGGCWRDPVNLRNGPVATFDQFTGDLIAVADNYALYQEDPGNIHHAYTGDFVKMRNTHAGSFEQHIFHFHNHQWLFNPNDDNGNYLDAQEIMPGSGHTYELVNGGAGNRNHTVGDAIFHCHFYPHFAQGMWYHMRNHDVFERGTVLAVSGNVQDTQNPLVEGDPRLVGPDGEPDTADDLLPDSFHAMPFALRSGKPAVGSRALPDGELPDGSPIPAIVPLPGKPMPQMPAVVQVKGIDRGGSSILGGRVQPGVDGILDSSQAFVDRTSVAGADGVPNTPDDVSPGYPFWLAGNECGEGGDYDTGVCPQGIVGQRMPTPPLDMLTEAGAMANAGNPNAPVCDEYDTENPEKCVKWNATTGTDWSNLGGGWDGGLPRHALLGYVSGSFSLDTQNRLDFRKIVEIAKPVYFPETGTDLEKVSMAYQAVRLRPSAANDLLGTGTTAGDFVLNGAPPVPGGPYNDPCVDDNGVSLKDGWIGNWYDGDGPRWEELSVQGRSPYDAENPRTYKIANLQIDAVFNKVGYHYSQERIIILWEDVKPTIFKQRPPEPLVMRFNTFDCGKLLHTNLVPHEFELDDFQVRTPTDIIGQHIHLPKWDLTTNDGAANGWNYEDGTLAPGIVEERILAINNFNALAGQPPIGVVAAAQQLGFDKKVHQDVVDALVAAQTELDLSDEVPVATIDTGDPGGTPAGLTELTAASHPFFGTGEGYGGQHYTGARTTIQRLLVDPVVNVAGVDRGLGLTFSHDHYGPSTFQQIGLYSTILAEPAGSTWVHNESGEPLGWIGDGSTNLDIDGPRNDGGPTSWQAAILPPDTATFGSTVKSEEIPDHREFYFEMSDFQHAYEAGLFIGADTNGVPVPSKITDPDYFDATKATIEPVADADGVPQRQALQDSWLQAVNPTLKLTAGAGVAANAFPDTVNAHPGCPGPAGQNDGAYPRPCPEAINIGHSSMWVVNFRNEPIGLRVFDPNKMGPDGRKGTQADGDAGDLALAFQTRRDRAISQLNDSVGDAPYPEPAYCGNDGGGGGGGGPGGGKNKDKNNNNNNQTGDGINCDRRPGDPFTPIMRAYMHDQVKIKIQVGATEEQHQTTVHGMKWLSNGSGFGRSGNSGWRNFQSHGISEQFSLQVPITEDPQSPGNSVDYLYATDATRDGIWTGTWGILRSYPNAQSNLFQLPENQIRTTNVVNENDFNGVCPRNANVVTYDVAAVLANDVLPNNLGVIINGNPLVEIKDNEGAVIGFGRDSDGNGIGDNVGGPLDPAGGTLVYNRRQTIVPDRTTPDGQTVLNEGGAGPLNDPTAMMYVRVEDLVATVASLDTVGNVPLDVDDVEGQDTNADGEPLWTSGPDGVDDRCQEASGSADPADLPFDNNLALAGCPAVLADTAPVEPLVLRANAGDCIDVTLHNKLVDQATANNGDVYSCVENPELLGTCLPDQRFEPLFQAGDVQDASDAGLLLVNSAGAPIVGDIVFHDRMPDLAGWQDTFWVVNRDLFKPIAERLNPPNGGPLQMRFFGNNLIAPSAKVGLHAQLVKYDGAVDDGVVVGENSVNTLAMPGGSKTYRYYAGDLTEVDAQGPRNRRNLALVANPIEFGGSNLLSADRIKQPQKGMFGALVIEPAGAVVTADTQVPDGQANEADTPLATRLTRAQVDVTAPVPATLGAGSGGTYRETVAVAHKIANLRWADGSTIKNVGQAEFGVEGAEDSGHAGFNYGMEPAWFRFKLPPDVPSSGAGAGPTTYGGIPNPQAMYANALVAGEVNAIPAIPGVSAAGDPQTPVFRTPANGSTDAAYDTRMHVLNGASADRDSTYILHGHVWPRDPYVCPGQAKYGLEGLCLETELAPSQALGLNPAAKYMGGEEGMGHVFGHWPILFDAGGTNAVTGDYLFRDYAPNGNRNGMFGILRVE